MLSLRTPVVIETIKGRFRGVVVARTREESPRYDVMLPSGKVIVSIERDNMTPDDKAGGNP